MEPARQQLIEAMLKFQVWEKILDVSQNLYEIGSSCKLGLLSRRIKKDATERKA